jgi:hypothetical protein
LLRCWLFIAERALPSKRSWATSPARILRRTRRPAPPVPVPRPHRVTKSRKWDVEGGTKVATAGVGEIRTRGMKVEAIAEVGEIEGARATAEVGEIEAGATAETREIEAGATAKVKEIEEAGATAAIAVVVVKDADAADAEGVGEAAAEDRGSKAVGPAIRATTRPATATRGTIRTREIERRQRLTSFSRDSPNHEGVSFGEHIASEEVYP